MTSIVGYIAVMDLTKASDIIRARTFDAFFPLVLVAVLYFLISYLSSCSWTGPNAAQIRAARPERQKHDPRREPHQGLRQPRPC